MSTFVVNNITYQSSGLTVAVVKPVSPYSDSITIPTQVTYNSVIYDVSSIANEAFYTGSDNLGLTSVIFPSSLTNIGLNVFTRCKNLTSVDLSGCSNLSRIGSNFLKESGVTTVRFPSGITIIGSNVLYDCPSLTSVDFSQCANLTTIGSYAFFSCDALTYVDLSPCIQLTTMNTNAFQNSGALTTVKFPSSMTSIGSDMFNNCTDLSYVDFSVCTNLTTIRNRVFQSSGIRSVAFPSTLTDMSYNNTFASCGRLAFITFTGDNLPAMNSTVFTGIASGVKAYMSVAASINPANTASKSVMTSNNPPITIQTSFIKNGINYNILGASTVAVGSNLTVSGSVFIPNQVTNNLVTYNVVRVDDNAFNSNHLITSINLSTCSSLTSIGYAAFGNTRIQSFALPSSLTYIGDAGFIENTILTSIDLLNCTNLTSIGSYAFYSCYSLTSVKFPSSLTSFGTAAFQACTNLPSVDLSNCTNLTTINDSVFQYNINLTSVRFPSSLTTINNNAFIQCYKLQSVIFPENLITIRDATFSSCSNLKNITFTGNSLDISANSFRDISSTPVAYMTYSAFINPANTASKSAMTNNIPPITINTTSINYRILTDSTVAVGNNQIFSGAVTIPNQVVINSVTYTVVRVDDNAFESNIDITSIDLSACSSLTTIGDDAFNDTTIQFINLPSSLTNIGNFVLFSCRYLTYVDFSVCTNLSSINGIMVLSGGSLDGFTSGITNVKFPSNIINIGSRMFSGCTNLISLDLSIYQNLLTIGDGMFKGHIEDTVIYPTSIQVVSFPPNLTSIGNQTFYYCSYLKNITFTGPILPAMNSTCFEGIPTGVKAYMTYNAFNNPVNAAYKLVMTSNDPPITIEILDPPPPPPPQKKKWIGGNRDSSNVVMQRRQNAIITNKNTPGPQTVNTSDNNVRIDALARVRGGGYTVPPKVTGRRLQF